MDEIAPCPFCGFTSPVSEFKNGQWRIICANCGVMFKMGWRATEGELVAAWNRRDMRIKTEKLKPCPFCGGPPEYLHGAVGFSRIKCGHCGIMTETGLIADVEDTWNTRLV